MHRTCATAVVLSCLVLSATAASVDNFGFFFNFGPNCQCGNRGLGVKPNATDGYDPAYDISNNFYDAGHAAIFHNDTEPGWNGPKDMYRKDYRAPLAPGASKTWGPIFVWALEEYYQQPTMVFGFEPDLAAVPPTDWTYTVELLYVPSGIAGAPAVGTAWDVDPTASARELEITVPTFYASDGFNGYQFAFTMTRPVPEPATIALLSVVAICGLHRRR
jgi:hypothetical protein